MQTQTASPRDSAGEELSQRIQKDVLRLALSFRNTNKRVDELLTQLSGFSNEEKSKNIDWIIGDLLAEITAALEKRTEQDPLKRFALKCETLGLELDAVQTILDGDTSSQTAESLATQIARTLQMPDPRIVALDNFCAELPVAESLKREFRALEAMIDKGAQEIGTLNSFKTLIDRLANELANRPNNADQHDNEIDPRQALLELMNLIEFPNALVERADSIRMSLNDDSEKLNLNQCLADISTLIAEIQAQLENEIHRLGSFLNNLSVRLEKLDSLLSASASNQERSLINQSQLQQDIEQQVTDMREGISSGTDIDEMRELISNRIDKLSIHLSDFVAEEGERYREATAQVSEMSETVSALESKTEKLNRDLERQKLALQLDPLTNIFNRSGYNKLVQDAMSRFTNQQLIFSLAVFDIDHFKKINDGFGHIAGDKVLINLARQVQSEIRKGVRLCRYGGEEFVIIMPNTSAETAYEFLEHLRAQIENYHFHHGETTVPVTISGGVAEVQQNDNSDLIFERADQALYRAKNSGRNQCQIAT
ncbi:MAG: diguanylate cyclase [Pseudomonadota bacterium]